VRVTGGAGEGLHGDGEAGLVVGAGVAAGDAVAESVEAGRHYCVAYVVVKPLERQQEDN